MKIIEYDDKYRDDMIFMVLEAKNALGRIPHLNEDLLDVKRNYFLYGDMFWLAIDDRDRVIGCIGYNKYDKNTAKLHRLYVKFNRKRQGIGTELLKVAERYMKEHGHRYSLVYLVGKEYFDSKRFYPKNGYIEYGTEYMKKEL